jgi:quercetin dioxygenase-like cupin family protein
MLKKTAFAAATIALVLAPASFAADAGYVPQRTILQQTDAPGSNYTVILAVTEIAPKMMAARHTHPGVEISYVLEGECDFNIEGIGMKHLKAGDSFRLESGVRHSVQNGNGTTKILAVYTIPKGAQLATPAP